LEEVSVLELCRVADMPCRERRRSFRRHVDKEATIGAVHAKDRTGDAAEKHLDDGGWVRGGNSRHVALRLQQRLRLRLRNLPLLLQGAQLPHQHCSAPAVKSSSTKPPAACTAEARSSGRCSRLGSMRTKDAVVAAEA
jgi:hypothetical protein